VSRREWDAIVIGLGGIGAGAAYWLSRSLGDRVLGLEQFPMFHERGESQDHSRIIRLSYHTPAYVELAKAAYDAWAHLEAELGEPLIVRTGGLDLFPPGAAIPMQDYTASMAAAGVPFDVLDAAETMRRWPEWRLDERTMVLFQQQSGIAPAARCNTAHVRLARGHGAVLLDERPVTAISAGAGGYAVTAGGETHLSGRLVIAAGPWTNDVLRHLGTELPLTVHREQVTYFATPHRDLFAPERFPIWIWMDDPSFYGFPVFGEPATKAAQDVGGFPTTADGRTFDKDEAGLERLRAFLAARLPRFGGPELYTKTCLYTLTPDRDFVLDTLPEHPGVAVAVGAGHAFKFASQLGRMLAQLVLDGSTPGLDRTAFAVDRPILREADPPRSWLV
jgi:sarcosine oxidase